MRVLVLLMTAFLLGRPLMDIFGLVPAGLILAALVASVEVALVAIESQKSPRTNPSRA